MSYYDERATRHQERVQDGENANLDMYAGMDIYSDTAIRVATVHTRQDLVLVVSHASSLNNQLATVRRLLWGIAVILLSILYLVAF